MNCKPYKYKLRIENIDATRPFFVGLYRVAQEQHYLMQDGMNIERVIRASEQGIEMKISFTVYSYAFGNCLFLVKVFNSEHVLVAQTCEFEIIARRNRKRTQHK